MDMSLTTDVMAIFVIFWPILAKIWQRPLDPCNQKCLLRIGRPRKPPVISNFSPKIGCHGNAPLSLVHTGMSQMNSQMAQTLSQNQTLHGYVAYN